MHTAVKAFVYAGAALAMAACQKNQSDQNIAIENTSAANAVIETLPPDESSDTPSNQLVNGFDNPDVNDMNASANSY
jgi:hypothetical protein